MNWALINQGVAAVDGLYKTVHVPGHTIQPHIRMCVMQPANRNKLHLCDSQFPKLDIGAK